MAEPLYCTLLIHWPCMRAEVWAAWAQAVLSAAAILAAARLAAWQMRSADRKRVDACVLVIGHTTQSIKMLAESARKKVGEVKPRPLTLGLIEASDTVLNAIAIDTVPEIKLYTPLAIGRSYSSLALSAAKAYNEVIAKGIALTDSDAELLERFAAEMAQLRAEAVAVSHSYEPWWVRLLKRR